VKLLIDTHIFLWWLERHPKLSASALKAISLASNSVYVSAASLWEITTKYRIGKLDLPCEKPEDLTTLVTSQSMNLLPILPSHALLAGSWDHPHRDPFDRMLAAQARQEGALLISNDAIFESFEIQLLN
jgi:PIN domain nuclease of toxin-antitoxin system